MKTSTHPMRVVMSAAIAVIVGALIWFVVYHQTGKTDPTGEDIYWKWGYPTIVVFGIIFGIFLGYQGWVFALGMLATQLFIVLLFSPRDNPQLPIGLMLYVAFAFPPCLGAILGAFFAKRIGNR
jgi:hypothetical protein